MPIAQPSSTLAAIQKKVRRLTRSLSADLLSDDELNDYVNTFVLYDFPENLRLFTYKTTFSFYTEPQLDIYITDANVALGVDNPLYDFKNKYISVHPPVYIGGRWSYYTQSRDEFFSLYPQTSSVSQVKTGNGILSTFSGTLSAKPILRNEVSFTSEATLGNALVVRDIPRVGDNLIGDLVEPGTTVSKGTINYVTGAYEFEFNIAGAPVPPANGKAIYSHTVPYVAAEPRVILYFNNKFTVRPVPDKAYKITFNVYQRPTYFMETTDEPELQQFWQYIAYGAAKKVFEDRSQIENVSQIMPAFKEQERLVLRRTLVQLEEQRTPTIYTQTTNSLHNRSGRNNF